jgi:hypothetical protein
LVSPVFKKIVNKLNPLCIVAQAYGSNKIIPV